MGRNRALAAFVAFVLSIAGLVAGSFATAGASTTTVTVNQTSLAPSGPWSSPSGADTGTAGFKTPPASPPAGSGALALNVPSGQHRAFYDYQYGICAAGPSCAGPYTTSLSSITSLGYSSYRIGATSALNAVPSFNIEIDTDPTNGGAVHYTTLVWEPSNNGGSLLDDTWQTWDAYNGGAGKFWATVAVPGVFPTAGPGGTQLAWSSIVSALPNAKIKYGIGVNVGTGPTFDGFADAVRIGLSGNDTIYDFETSTVNTVIRSTDVSLFPSPTTQWVSNDDNSAAPGNVSFVNGPGTPPVGVGSARFDTATASGASALEYLNFANAATRFSQISDLRYSTYRSSVDGGNNLAVALQFNADYDKTDGTNTFQGRLVFEPYQTFGGGVPQNTWQTWTPLTGKWWMSASLTFPPKVGNGTVPNACPQALPCTWAQVLAAYPKAGFLNNPSSPQPFVILKAGSGGSWPGFVGNADGLRLSIDGSEANFDLEPTCTTDCYVSTTGSDSNTGTAAYPFLTIQKGVDTVSVGGTVHVANGTYPVGATINKNLTLDGQSRGGTIINGTNTGTGLNIGATSGVSVTNLTVQHFGEGIRTITGPLSNFLVQHVDVVDNAVQGIHSEAFGINGYTLDDVNSSRNGGSIGRGVWIINGAKQNVTITNSTFDQNGLVGIDLSDGSVTGATITGNTVTNNGDSGIGVLGAIAGGANLVANNTVTNNGRYGIEIKNGTGNGTDTGTASLTVDNNNVSRTAAATDARDYGGIVVIRRNPVLGDGNPNLPTGVVIENNTVSGFHRKPVGSTGDGFGIVVGGTGHVITKNVVSNNDVGVQVQAGNTSNAQSTDGFDRDDSASGNAGVSRNSIAGNGVGMRGYGTITGTTADCNWWGSASGPSAPGGGGSGDSIATGIPFSTWLTTSNLNATCAGTPTVSVGSTSQLEGSGTDPVVNLPVTLSSPIGSTVTVQYATANGSGPTGAVAPSDYTAASGTVTFLPGETAKTVPITIRGNASPIQFDEKDETFTVGLSSPTNATVGTSPGTITILNDDTPTVSLGASIISTVEGNAGTHNVQVPVSLTNPSAFPITVGYSTTSGTATAPSDYATASGTLTIPAGQVTASIPVTINGDTLDETNETFTVSIASPGGGGSVPPILGNATQTVRITNDDTPTVSVSNAVIDTLELNSGTHAVPVNVTLSNPSVVGITVNYATAIGSAVTPSDFVAASGTVTFAPGQTTKTFNVNVKGDSSLEDYEFFTVSISSPTAAATAPTVLGNAMEPIQILNDEKPSLTGTNVSGAEGSTLQFGATLVQRFYLPITVNYATVNGTAAAPGDFTATSGNITFLAGTNGTQTVGVPTNFDFTTEVAEKFSMTWSSPGSIKVSPVTKTGTIKSNHT